MTPASGTEEQQVMDTTTDQQLQQAYATIELLTESLHDVQQVMDRDNRGWAALGSLDADLAGFDHDFRRRQAARILVAATANPLIRRGVALRCAYVWGEGVQVGVDDQPNQGQDVGAVIQAFYDDPGNQQTWVARDAQLAMERELCISGEVWLCLPTDPATGRVRVRQIPAAQIVEIRVDPEDEASEQLYLRRWTQPGSRAELKAWYPRLGYQPAIKPAAVDGVEVRWNQPVRLVRVNQVRGRGVGDAFAAVAWADAHKGWLENWATYMRALVRFAWSVRTAGDRVTQTAAAYAQAAARAEAGQGWISDPNTTLTPAAIGGAQIDADGGRPLAVMVAAALDIPVTTLLGDPGATGARAVAEVVSADSAAVFGGRQELWRTVITDVVGWVIDAAVIAPAGPLRGTITRDGDTLIVTLPDTDTRVVGVEFPHPDPTTLLDRLRAIQIADQAQLLPPATVAREYLTALGVDTVDEIMDQLVVDGQWVGPTLPDLQGWMDRGHAGGV